MKKLLSTYKIRCFVRVSRFKKNRVLAIKINFSLSDFHHKFTKNRQTNVEKMVEKQKGTFLDVKTLQVHVFFAPGSLLESLGEILGRSRSSCEALLVALGALRERPGDLPPTSGWPRGLRRCPGTAPRAILGRFWMSRVAPKHAF